MRKIFIYFSISQLTSERVVKAFIERCRDINGIVNAIVEDRFLEAVEDAKKVDQLISSGKKSEEELQNETPLLGVPITVKEACKLSGKPIYTASYFRVYAQCSNSSMIGE